MMMMFCAYVFVFIFCFVMSSEPREQNRNPLPNRKSHKDMRCDLSVRLESRARRKCHCLASQARFSSAAVYES